jgi:hypothetical protein
MIQTSIFLLQAFIALSCLVAAVVADGPHAHAHGHAPHRAPLPLLAPLRPLAHGPLAIAPVRPIVAPLRPHHPAPYAPPPPPPPPPAYGPAPGNN